MTNPPPEATPSRHRMALALIPFVYGLITAILYVLAPFTQGWAIWQRSLLVTPIMVGAMVYGVTPFVQRRLARPREGRPG